MATEFDGTFTAETSREHAYRVLSDPDRFAPLLPTYVDHSRCEDGSTDVRVRVGVGKIRGTATVNLQLVEHHEPVSATWAGKGKIMGGAFNLTATFDLEERGKEETEVAWRGELTILGKLVSLAGGLIRPVAKKQAGELVDEIQAALAGDAGSATRPAGTAKT